MYRIFVVLGILLCSLPPLQAQSKVAVSKIDSLAKHFAAAKDNAAKINVLVNAPQRIAEYYAKPAAILHLYNKAVKVAESIGDKKSLIPLLIEIAHLQMHAFVDEPKAFQLYSQALSYAEEEKDYALGAQICYSLGVINQHQNFMAEMYEYLFKSVEYAEKSSTLYLTPYQGLQIMFLEEGRVNEALSICEKCIKYLNQRKGSVENKLLAYGLLLEVLNRMPNKKQEADECSRKVARLLGEINNSRTHNLSDRDIALICNEAKQYNLAIYYAGLPLKELDTNKKLNTEAMLCYEVISNAYARLGQYQKSLENYKKYSKLYIEEIRNTITMESGRKVIRAEGESNLLLKQKEIDQEKLYRNISFAIAAFIVVLGAVILFFYRREQQQKRELTHLNATKDKLFAILSHDLRSPVGNLENNVMLTNWGALSQEEFIQSTQSLGQEIGQVRTMLDNVLHWSISQMGGMKPNKATMAVFSVIEEQIKLIKVAAATKHIQVVNQISPTVQIIVDKNHIAIVFRNLLHNSLKFTHSGGEVRLDYEEKRGVVYLKVKDTGIGMSKERLDKLFELDKDSSRLGTAQEQGTGLGLVLVKELVEANGGTIQVSSEVNQGTAFVIGFKKETGLLP